MLSLVLYKLHCTALLNIQIVKARNKSNNNNNNNNVMLKGVVADGFAPPFGITSIYSNL